MGDWQELGQVIFITLVFCFLVAKLISIAISIKESNLKLTRSVPDPESEPEPKSDSESEEVSREESEREIVVNADAKNKGVVIDSDDDDDGDDEEEDESDNSWEGIESTELDEEFSLASAFVATMASTSESARVPNDVQLKLYGLYKIATEGPCTTPQPSALNFTARAKWNAWQKLGAMPTEEAMEQYILLVTEIFPTWDSGSSLKKKRDEDENTGPSNSAQKGPMGPVFSSYVDEEGHDSNNTVNLNAIHVAAREGFVDDLIKQLDSGISVNLKEGEGRTPLHWAVDRGQMNVISTLLDANADVNAKDNEGQTPLHYAVLCEREEIAELLVKSGADRKLKDNDGNSPMDLCDSDWPSISKDDK